MMIPAGLRALLLFARLAALALLVSSCGETTRPTEARHEVVATPDGGTYVLSDSVTLAIPAGAVSEETTLGIRILTADELAEIFSPSGLTPEDLLLGFEGTPDGQTFAEAITLSFRGLPIQAGDLINVYEVDGAAKTYAPAMVGHTVRPAEGVVALSLSHFSIDAATRQRWRDEARKAREEECKNPETKCRCGTYEAKPEAQDVSCTAGSCQLVETKWQIEYKDCGYTESSLSRELTEGCRLGVDVSANPQSIEPLESSQVTARAYLGCSLYALEGGTTTFSVSGLGSLSDTSASTDAEGKARTTFTAGNELGEAAVKAETEATYLLYERVATRKTELGTFTETVLGPERTESAEGQTTITIAEVEHWQVVGTATTSYSLHGPGGYHWVDWSVSGEAEVSFSFDLDRAAIVAGGQLDVVTTGTGTQTTSAVIDAFDASMYESATIENAYFPATLDFQSVEITGWAEGGEVAIYVLACVKPDTTACCDGDIYHYDLLACDFGATECYDMTTTADFGTSCIAFGLGDVSPVVVEGTREYQGASYYGREGDSYTLTFTRE